MVAPDVGETRVVRYRIKKVEEVSEDVQPLNHLPHDVQTIIDTVWEQVYYAQDRGDHDDARVLIDTAEWMKDVIRDE